MLLALKRPRQTGFSAFLVLLLLAFSLVLAGPAEAKSRARVKRSSPHKRARAVRHAPVVQSSARYADIVIDAETGRILLENNSEAQRHPASLTKMMTLYLTFQALESGVVRLETPLEVSANAAAQSPTKLGVRPGQRLRVYDAVLGLITESANDAAVVLAENLGGTTSHFVDLMNAQARALGMRHTLFQNPSGLPDPDQVTNARDMATLGMALVSHYPGFYPYFSRQSFVYAGRTHKNHNHLMERYVGMDGIKTGYVRASGFNLVASAVRGETRLIGVVFGGKSAPSRDRQMEDLLNEAFLFLMSKNEGAPTSRDFLPQPSKVAAAFPPQGGGGTRRAAASAQPANAPTAPPARQQPATTQEDTPTGGWGLQVGAFSDVASAQQALSQISRQLAPLLDQAEPSLQKITLTDGSAMYRARFTGLTQNGARTACSHLIQRGQGCLVVSGP